MNVRPAPDLSPTQPVEAVRPDRALAQGARPGTPPAPASGDRVELSAGARAAKPPAAQSPEIEAARVALRAGSGLSPARLHELREQVRTGHYDQPEMIERITGVVARDLGRAE